MAVGKAETKVVLGGSGSGKSTILRMVLGLVKPDSGEIFVEDEEITRLGEDALMPIRKRIGIVFQEGALFDSLSVQDNVAYRMREEGNSTEEEMEAAARRLLGFVGAGTCDQQNACRAFGRDEAEGRHRSGPGRGAPDHAVR